MANTYKNIVITPNTGSSTGDPTVVFSGANTSVNTDITLRVYPESNGTLSFEGSAGQLFSITNDLSGTLFSVNDVSGMPLIEANANGFIGITQPTTLTYQPYRRNTPNISTNYTVSNTYNEMSIGPINIANGVTVTVDNGANWVIV